MGFHRSISGRVHVNTSIWALEHSHTGPRTFPYGPSDTTIWTLGHFHMDPRTLPCGPSDTPIWALIHFHMDPRTLQCEPLSTINMGPRTLPYDHCNFFMSPRTLS